jgi:hypothetical protein
LRIIPSPQLLYYITLSYIIAKMGVTDRIIQIGGQISGNPTAGGREKILQKNPDDVSFQDTKSYFMR